MKKVAFLVLTCGLIMNSCSKNQSDDRETNKRILFDQIDYIKSQEIDITDSDYLLLSNCDNPFDEAGKITGKITNDLLIKAKGKMINDELITSEYLTKISEALSGLGLLSNINDINEEELQVSKYLVEIYLLDGFDIFNYKTKEIEKVIYTSDYFNENQKERILVNSSMLRHTLNAINLFCLEEETSKAQPWKDCFYEKLRELQDCGNCWIERIYCSLSWPTCLGVKALDCAIDAIF